MVHKGGERSLVVLALGDQGIVCCDGLWSALQPTNLVLEGAHLILEFYQHGGELI
jgi:hypothetical protein